MVAPLIALIARFEIGGSNKGSWILHALGDVDVRVDDKRMSELTIKVRVDDKSRTSELTIKDVRVDGCQSCR